MLGQRKELEGCKKLPGFLTMVVFRDLGTLNDRNSFRELLLRTVHEVQAIPVERLVDIRITVLLCKYAHQTYSVFESHPF